MSEYEVSDKATKSLQTAIGLFGIAITTIIVGWKLFLQAIPVDPTLPNYVDALQNAYIVLIVFVIIAGIVMLAALIRLIDWRVYKVSSKLRCY